MEKQGWYLVGYDICCPKRLSRVHRYLKKEGLAVQKSLLFINSNPTGLERLLAGLDALIDPSQDDVRAYPISHPSRVWMSGGPLARFPMLTTGHQTQTAKKPNPWWRRWFPKK